MASIGRCYLRLFCFCALLLAAGCSSQQTPPPERTEGNEQKLNDWLRKHDSDLPPTIYRVEAPDKIKVLAPGVKEIDQAVCEVRPDGKVTLNLVGPISVAGLSTAEIAERIAQQLGNYYQKETLDIRVQVVEFKSKRVYVMGQVVIPGIKPFTGTNTVLSTLAEARLNELAWPQKVVIIRTGDDPTVKERVTVDIKKMYETGDVQQNFLLEEGDVVYVPPSPIAHFAMQFGKVIYPLIPVSNLALMASGL